MDEERTITVEAREQCTLPDDFELYTTCQRDHWINARGYCESGVWTTTLLLSVIDDHQTRQQLWKNPDPTAQRALNSARRW